MVLFYKRFNYPSLILFLLAFSISSLSLSGQTAVSNLTCGYEYGNTPAPQWNSILGGSGTTVVDSGTGIDNQNYMNNEFPAGFTFDFNGTVYTSFNISANGFIFFGNTDPGNISNPISNATTDYEGAIAALGANIQAHNNSSNTPQILIQYSGIAPDRVATIEWCAFKPQGNSGGFCGAFGFNDANRYDFQIKLYENGGENSNTIDIIHKNQGPVCIDGNSLSAQVGLRGATNTDFRNRSRSGSTNNTNTSEGSSNTATITHGAAQYFNANTRMRYTPKIQPAGIAGETEVCVEDGISISEANNGSLSGMSYQWYTSPANSAISGETTSEYSANPGVGSYSYYVTVSNSGGCLRVSDPYTVSVIICGEAPETVTVTASAEGNGSIDPEGVTTYDSGETPTYTFTPDCGYEVTEVLVNGIAVAIDGSYTFSALYTNQTIAVTFTKKVEVCNGIDDDCDGFVDNVENLELCEICQEGVIVELPEITWYLDSDGDGFGNPGAYLISCIQPLGYVTNSDDCDDSDSEITDICLFTITATAGSGGTISPAGEVSVFGGESIDFDISPDCGYEVTDVLVNGVSAGAIVGYSFTSVNSDQTIEAFFTQKVEVCNGIDDDCDGIVDNVENLAECEVCQEGVLIELQDVEWYEDSDGDGFGNPLVSITSCVQPDGYVANSDDCDDSNSEITDLCLFTITATAGSGGTVSPEGETSVFDGENIDYDIIPDCGYEVTDVLVNGVSVGAVEGYTFTSVSSDQTIEAFFAQKTEVCNGIDDDCDGIIDNVENLAECEVCQEGVLIELQDVEWFEDSDGDGFGNPLVSTTSCVQPDGYVANSDDCDDSNSEVTDLCLFTITATSGSGGTVSPEGETSVFDGESIDYDIIPDCGYEVTDVLVNGVSVGAVEGYTFTSVSSDQTIEAFFAQKTEVCNGIDDDCDGIVDNVQDLSSCEECLNGELITHEESVWYADLDGDGHGDINNSISDCTQPDGFVSNNNDCDDSDQLIWLAKPVQIVLNLNPNHACIDGDSFELGTVEPDNGVWSGDGVSGNMFTPATAGLGVHTITYFVAGDGQCELPASASSTMTVTLCDNVQEFAQNSVSIYPTATRGILTIAGQALVSASVIDLNGRLIESYSLRESSVIDLSNCASGMYFVRVETQRGDSVHKIIKVD